MSSQVPEGYTIVNRVAQSPHLAREIEKLSPVEDTVYSVPTTVVQAAATPMGPGQTEFEKREFKTADGGTVTGAEIVRPEKALQAELAKLEYEIDKVSLDKFNDFRDQVIRAFKHFGLDTRQFFG